MGKSPKPKSFPFYTIKLTEAGNGLINPKGSMVGLGLGMRSFWLSVKIAYPQSMACWRPYETAEGPIIISASWEKKHEPQNFR